MLASLKLTPIRICALYLSLLAIVAVGVKMDLSYFVMRAVSFVALSAGFMAIPLFKYRAGAFKYPFFTNSLITILILYLVLDEFVPWWQFIGVGLIAAAIKNFVRINRLPVFNPAAAGIAVAVVLGLLETWWGASFAPRYTELEISVAVLLTIPFGLYLSYKYKKWAVWMN